MPLCPSGTVTRSTFGFTFLASGRGTGLTLMTRTKVIVVTTSSRGKAGVAGAEGDAVCTLLVCNSFAQLPLNIHAYIRKRELCNTRAYVCA